METTIFLASALRNVELVQRGPHTGGSTDGNPGGIRKVVIGRKHAIEYMGDRQMEYGTVIITDHILIIPCGHVNDNYGFHAWRDRKRYHRYSTLHYLFNECI
jgi:hypothetical protein